MKPADAISTSNRSLRSCCPASPATAGDVFVYGLGRDAWSARRRSRLWRQAWYQSGRSQFGSDRRQQIEHESLALLLADKRGVPVPDVVTVGMTRTGDALLVTDLGDRTLAETSADEVDDDLLDCGLEAARRSPRSRNQPRLARRHPHLGRRRRRSATGGVQRRGDQPRRGSDPPGRRSDARAHDDPSGR